LLKANWVELGAGVGPRGGRGEKGGGGHNPMFPQQAACAQNSCPKSKLKVSQKKKTISGKKKKGREPRNGLRPVESGVPLSGILPLPPTQKQKKTKKRSREHAAQ